MDKQRIEQIFSYLGGSQSGDFFDHVSDEVQWTVYGEHPTSGHFHTKQDFLEATIQKIVPLLKDEQLLLELTHLTLDGMTATAELIADTQTKNGNSFKNHYCWVCRFEGEQIIQVREYLDPVAIKELFELK